jgi:hypothetical protein
MSVSRECNCTNRQIYACQGCGKVVSSDIGIEYAAIEPYKHTKAFCDIGCVYRKHSAILRYIASGDIDGNEKWTVEYLKTLSEIEARPDKLSQNHSSYISRTAHDVIRRHVGSIPCM